VWGGSVVVEGRRRGRSKNKKRKKGRTPRDFPTKNVLGEKPLRKGEGPSRAKERRLCRKKKFLEKDKDLGTGRTNGKGGEAKKLRQPEMDVQRGKAEKSGERRDPGVRWKTFEERGNVGYRKNLRGAVAKNHSREDAEKNEGNSDRPKKKNPS